MQNPLMVMINEAMDLHDQLREKMLDILNYCHQHEGLELIVDEVNKAATPLVNANTALEDVLSAIEDHVNE